MTSVPRRLGRVLVIAGLAAGCLIIAFAAAPSTAGQRADPSEGWRRLTILTGRGAEIGASVRDVGPADRQPGEPRSTVGAPAAGGVVVDDVRPGSPAEKAGLKRADLIVEFDGERVRSARQFARLVQETPAARTVTATISRGGERKELQVAPDEGSSVWRGSGDWLRDRFGELHQLHDFRDAQPGSPGPFQQPFDFNFDFGIPGARGRLGITIEELTPQLATYFGARDGGVLVTSVVDDSPAARAGLKAGDVITKMNGQVVRSGGDLVRLIEGVKDDEAVTIGIVRDRSDTTVTAKLESRQRPRRGRPV
jgi:serine protease Do